MNYRIQWEKGYSARIQTSISMDGVTELIEDIEQQEHIKILEYSIVDSYTMQIHAYAMVFENPLFHHNISQSYLVDVSQLVKRQLAGVFIPDSDKTMKFLIYPLHVNIQPAIVDLTTQVSNNQSVPQEI